MNKKLNIPAILVFTMFVCIFGYGIYNIYQSRARPHSNDGEPKQRKVDLIKTQMARVDAENETSSQMESIKRKYAMAPPKTALEPEIPEPHVKPDTQPTPKNHLGFYQNTRNQVFESIRQIDETLRRFLQTIAVILSPKLYSILG